MNVYILDYLRGDRMHTQATERGITGSRQRALILKGQLLATVGIRIALLLLLVSITYTFTSSAYVKSAYASTHSSTKSWYRAAPANTAYLTYKFDNMRTGQNPNEAQLNETTVNSSTFGKHVSYSVDGNMYAQPLFVPNLT